MAKENEVTMNFSLCFHRDSSNLKRSNSLSFGLLSGHNVFFLPSLHFFLETKIILFMRQMVPRAGLEPARSFLRGILSPLCLPISPPGQRCQILSSNDTFCSVSLKSKLL